VADRCALGIIHWIQPVGTPNRVQQNLYS
jgi:hypothetical protein